MTRRQGPMYGPLRPIGAQNAERRLYREYGKTFRFILAPGGVLTRYVRFSAGGAGGSRSQHIDLVTLPTLEDAIKYAELMAGTKRVPPV